MADSVTKEEEFSGTKEVEERHRVDELRLDGWMCDNVEGYQGPLVVLQFKGGQSNPTYRVDTPGRCYVMRRKPFGKLLPSAHAIDREFKVIAALSKQGFPVARTYALCTDDAVIGAAFYIMSMEEGRVFWDPTLPSQTPEARRAIFTSKIETLAKLHAYDPAAIGLYATAAEMRGATGDELRKKILGGMFTKAFPKDEFDWVVAENLKLPREQAARLLINSCTNDWRDILPTINVPTLIIGGDASFNKRPTLEWLKSQIPGATLVWFGADEGGSHFSFMENPEKFNAVIADFGK